MSEQVEAGVKARRPGEGEWPEGGQLIGEAVARGARWRTDANVRGLALSRRSPTLEEKILTAVLVGAPDPARPVSGRAGATDRLDWLGRVGRS